MLGHTKIPYLDALWHPTTGCSAGCGYCWARELVRNRLAGRMAGVPAVERSGYPDYEATDGDPFRPRFHEDRLEDPLRARKPRAIGVSFFGDLFDWEISTAQIRWVRDVTRRALPLGHRFVFLTRRVGRLAGSIDGWPDNCWMGATVTSRVSADLWLGDLRATNATHRWLSLEPLLGPVDLRGRLDEIGAVVVGGMSGRQHADHPLNLDWVREIRDRCEEAGVPFAFKQSSGLHPEQWPELDGRRHMDVPWMVSSDHGLSNGPVHGADHG